MYQNGSDSHARSGFCEELEVFRALTELGEVPKKREESSKRLQCRRKWEEEDHLLLRNPVLATDCNRGKPLERSSQIFSQYSQEYTGISFSHLGLMQKH